jgi:hypothetical protein
MLNFSFLQTLSYLLDRSPCLPTPFNLIPWAFVKSKDVASAFYPSNTLRLLSSIFVFVVMANRFKAVGVILEGTRKCLLSFEQLQDDFFSMSAKSFRRFLRGFPE